MKSFFRKIHRWMRRGESGQSVIILAIGFIALVGFVGITTDVALMFVRYSQLSRAVDASAIAAANQMRTDRTQASLGIAARQFIELYGLNPTKVLVDTCNSLPFADRASDELCRADQAKLVRVTAQVESPTVFMRLLGFQNFTLQASSVSETAALDVVIIMDSSESMASLTTVEDWARDANRGVIYRPPRAMDIYAAKYPVGMANRPREDEFWEGTGVMPAADSLLSTWQQNVNNRLYYTGAPGNIVGVADTAYQVFYNKTYFEATYGTQEHPRLECRVRFYPQSIDYPARLWQGYRTAAGDLVPVLNNSSAANYNNSLFGRAGLVWPVANGNSNWDGFVPTYNFYGCCNDPQGASGTGAADFNFSDLVCQPFKQARSAVLDFMDRVDFTRGDRMAIVTFDRSAFLINPYGYIVGGTNPSCVAGNRVAECRPGAMMDNQADATYALKTLVGVRSEPNFYVFNPGNIVSTQRTTASWTGFAAGLNVNGSSRPVDYGKTSNPAQFDVTNFQVAGNNNGQSVYPELTNFPVFNDCPYATAGAARTDRTLFDFGLHRASLPNEGLDSAWRNYADNGVSLYGTPGDALSYNTLDYSYDYYGSCRGSNIGAGLREGSNALLDPTTIRQSGTVWVMILLANGGAGGSDPVRRDGGKLTASQPYAWNPGVSGFGVSGQYGAQGLCPFGNLRDVRGAAELARPANDSPGKSALFPFCSDEAPRTRYFCNFRPLFIPPIPNGSAVDPLPPILKNAETGAACSVLGGSCRQVPPMGDKDYVFFDPSPPLWYGTNGPQTAAAEGSWNSSQGNLYDVDLTACTDPITGVDNANYYDADDYAHDWADYVGLRRDEESDVLLPTIFTIGFGTEFSSRTLNGNTLDIKDSNNADALCKLNLGDCLGEQLLRYIADVGDNNKIDNDWYQAMLKPLKDGGGVIIPRTTSATGGFGPRDPCQRQDQSVPPSGQYADDDTMYGQLAPQANCGNYYYAPDYNQLQFVFDDIASRMFTRLSR